MFTSTPRTQRKSKVSSSHEELPLISPGTQKKFQAARRSFEEETEKLSFSYEKLLKNSSYYNLINKMEKHGFTTCLKVLTAEFCDVLLEPNIIKFVEEKKLTFEQICTTSYLYVLECKYGEELLEKHIAKDNISIAVLNAEFKKELPKISIAERYSDILFKSYKGKHSQEYSLENLQTNLAKETTEKKLPYNEVKELILKNFILKLNNDFSKRPHDIYKKCCELIKEDKKTPLHKRDIDFWQNVFSKIIDTITSNNCSLKYPLSDPIPRRKESVSHFAAKDAGYTFNALRQLTILNKIFYTRKLEITCA